jgi:hypothetical protein
MEVDLRNFDFDNFDQGADSGKGNFEFDEGLSFGEGFGRSLFMTKKDRVVTKYSNS